MRIISPKKIRQFWASHPDSRSPLARWIRTVRNAEWDSFEDVRLAMGKRVDRHKRLFVFDIGGNKYRLVAAIHFNTGIVFVRRIMTHADYDGGKWKET